MKNDEIVKTEVRGGSGRLCGTDDICTMTYRSESQLFRHFYFAAWKVRKQSIQHPESRQQGRADDKNRTNTERRPVAAVAVCDSRAWKAERWDSGTSWPARLAVGRAMVKSKRICLTKYILDSN